MPKTNKTLEERFWSKVQKTEHCWNWTGATRKRKGSSYGSFRVGDRIVQSHRFAYQLLVGEIPEGLDVLHTCDNPACINPEHLYVGTHQHNMQDKVEKGRQYHPDFRGEKNNQAKLTWEQVKDIRYQYATGTPMKQLAANYRVLNNAISRIVTFKRWNYTDN